MLYVSMIHGICDCNQEEIGQQTSPGMTHLCLCVLLWPVLVLILYGASIGLSANLSVA